MAGHTQNGGGQSGALASHAQWPHTPTPVDTFPAYLQHTSTWPMLSNRSEKKLFLVIF